MNHLITRHVLMYHMVLLSYQKFVVVKVEIICMCKFDILFGEGFARSFLRMRCCTIFKTFCNLIFKLPFDVLVTVIYLLY